jgi:hypothetical protein
MPHERVRPDWWMGVNGAELELPKTRNEGQKVSYFDGFVLEEIFWNWRHNGFFNTRELDPYISQGQSPTLQLIKRWNAQRHCGIVNHESRHLSLVCQSLVEIAGASTMTTWKRVETQLSTTISMPNTPQQVMVARLVPRACAAYQGPRPPSH